MPDLTVLKELKKGDIVTLSDPQTEIIMGGPSDFEIIEKRTYSHDLFKIYAYVLSGAKEEDNLFFMIKVVDGQYDLRVYYLDHGGTKEEVLGEGWNHWNEDGDSFSLEFIAEMATDEDENSYEKIVFKQKDFGAFYDVILHKYIDREGDAEELLTSICEYETEEEIENPDVFIEWTGEFKGGWVEVYYGSLIHSSHVEAYPKA